MRAKALKRAPMSSITKSKLSANTTVNRPLIVLNLDGTNPKYFFSITLAAKYMRCRKKNYTTSIEL
jgi:hypothetical protein